MKIKIIALGKVREKYLSAGIDEFQKRLKPYVNLEIVELNQLEIKDENLTDKILKEEGEKILSNIKAESYVITLEIEGKSLSSVEFSQKIEDLMVRGVEEIVFVIGSSCGLSRIVSQRANFKMSMSKMTFLLNFARLLLLEQIYRAYKIMRKETYHK